MKYYAVTITDGKVTYEVDSDDREGAAATPLLDFGYTATQYFPETIPWYTARATMLREMIKRRLEHTSRILAKVSELEKLMPGYPWRFAVGDKEYYRTGYSKKFGWIWSAAYWRGERAEREERKAENKQ